MVLGALCDTGIDISKGAKATTSSLGLNGCFSRTAAHNGRRSQLQHISPRDHGPQGFTLALNKVIVQGK